jgi:hypothetical protein
VWLLNAASGHGGLAFPAAYHVGALLVAVALLAADSGYLAPLRGVLRFYGWAAFLVCTYLLTFRGLVTDSLKWTEVAFATDLKLQTCLYGWGSFGLALLAWGKVIWDLTRQAPSAARLEFEAWLVPGTALAALLLAATGLYRYSAPGAALFNLVVLAVAATWMARGCREGELRSVWLGSGLLVAVAVARYFDLFESLAARGLVFLLVGGALFAEGFFYRRAQPADQERRAGS